MAKRIRYTDENPALKRLQRRENGATDDEPRMTSEQAAEALGVPKRTLTRWYSKMRFPSHPEFAEAYEPEEEWIGNQMRLLWPACVVDRIRSLLDDTKQVAGTPGMRRLPEVEWGSE